LRFWFSFYLGKNGREEKVREISGEEKGSEVHVMAARARVCVNVKGRSVFFCFDGWRCYWRVIIGVIVGWWHVWFSGLYLGSWFSEFVFCRYLVFFFLFFFGSFHFVIQIYYYMSDSWYNDTYFACFAFGK
jgi:hypothetical protein